MTVNISERLKKKNRIWKVKCFDDVILINTKIFINILINIKSHNAD